jgi:oligopeptide transport system substrate-binding protein
MRTRATLIAAGALAITAGLIASPALAATKKKPVVFVDLQNFAAGEPDHIDPAITTTLTGVQVTGLIYDTLTDTAANGDLVPGAAAKWTTADSGKTWVFTLKKGGKFSTGEPVTPTSFLKGWIRATDSKTASEVAYHSYLIQGFEEWNTGKGPVPTSVVANDKANTLTVSLKIAFSGFPAVASHTVFAPIPKTMYEADGKVEESGTSLVGNGPYMLKKQITKQVGGEIVLIRNPKYSGTKGTLDEIQFKIGGDVAAVYNAFESGQGVSAAVPPGRYKEALAKYGDRGLGPVLGIDFWGLRYDDPIIGGPKNQKLRTAIVKAIDRNQLTEAIYQGQRKATDQLVPPGIPGRANGLGITGGKGRDLEGAKADFAAWKSAGNELKEPLRLSFNEGAGWDKVATIMIGNLKDVGIDAKLDQFAKDGTYFSKMREGKGQIMRLGWFADYTLQDNFLFPLLHKDSIGGDNASAYNNDAFNKLVDQARATADPKASAALYVQAEKIALEDGVVMPTTVRANNMVFSEKVTKIEINPLGYILYNQATLAP